MVPGREQRLQDVVVEGHERTRPSAVVNALRLEPGEPVDLARWAQARKRVYDMNIFRQVDVRPEPLPDARADGPKPCARASPSPSGRSGACATACSSTTTQPGQAGQRHVAGPVRGGLGVVADLQNRNVFGRAFTFGLYGRAERRVQSGSAYLTFPTLFGRAVQTNVFGSSASPGLEIPRRQPRSDRAPAALVDVDRAAHPPRARD